MAERDKDGQYKWNDEEAAQIEMGAQMRVRADEIREERAAKKKAEEEEIEKEKNKAGKKLPEGWK